MTVRKTLKRGHSNQPMAIQEQTTVHTSICGEKTEDHPLDTVVVKANMGHVLSEEENSVVK